LAQGQTYYGWVQLSYPNSSGTATITGWAYQSDPGVGIAAGATSDPDPPVPAPEPSTLGLPLVALGCVGIVALKRHFKRAK
jgi:hypothetical protein